MTDTLGRLMSRCHSALWLIALAMASQAINVRAEESSTNPAPELLIVMSDGRTLRGRVTRHAIGCYVERSGGTILIPKEQIRCVARDLRDAYRQQREQMIDPTSAMLIQLAEWCIAYRMYDEAGDELRRALRRDPENDVARKMLSRLDEMLRAEPTKSYSTASVDATGFLTTDVESLGGLSKSTAAEFTAKIQPLLINKCANAGCHGGEGTDSFRLTHVRLQSPNHRRAAEQNLAAVLKLIDADGPAQTRLLTAADGAHGGAILATFGGSGGSIQRDLLRGWVQTVITERRADAEQYAQRTPLKQSDSKSQRNPATISTASAEEPVAELPAVKSSNVRQVSAETMPEMDELPGANRPPRPLPRHDPFDPEEFNQQSLRAESFPRKLR
ncbi:MAG: hypothetical protein B7Z55_03350 [Planctomycetales bacterium 12-60-4]|nr:MAG: hypothetical protein B7Z55_03350 [Planctomycetales bacterium 12-60-4]